MILEFECDVTVRALGEIRQGMCVCKKAYAMDSARHLYCTRASATNASFLLTLGRNCGIGRYKTKAPFSISCI